MGLERLRTMIASLTKLVECRGNLEAAILPEAKVLMADLVAHDDWLPDRFARADAHKYCQYLLYGDPLDRFSLVSFVWGPGQRTPVHDHLVWGLVGMLRGEEEATPFTRMPDRALVAGRTARLSPGMVEAVSPTVGDIHQVANALADAASISIHLYGGNIGSIRRNAYDLASGEARPFVSGYSAEVVPNLWV